MTQEPSRSFPMISWAHERVRRSTSRARLALWRAEGARLHPDVHLFGRITLIGDPRGLRIGAGSSLNEGVHLELRDSVWIGADVHLSAHVKLHTGELVPEVVPRVHRSAPIVIEDHVWVAAGAIVGAGVRIGRGAVVGAGAVVLEDVAPWTFVAGVPARLIRPLEAPDGLPSGARDDEVGRRRLRRRNGPRTVADR